MNGIEALYEAYKNGKKITKKSFTIKGMYFFYDPQSKNMRDNDDYQVQISLERRHKTEELITRNHDINLLHDDWEFYEEPQKEMKNDEIKFCKDCKWYNSSLGSNWCERPIQSLIENKKQALCNFCFLERADDNGCAKEANYFEPKEKEK